MITITTDEQLCASSCMPNFVVYDWMRTGLNLTGLNIMLFALIFSQSFDENHSCAVTLTSMEKWFGITRQTLARNIEKLPCIHKAASKNNPDGSAYYHKYYYVDMDEIMHTCEKVSDNAYNDFMTAYEQILKLKFPNDKSKIETYFAQIKQWHNSHNITDIDAVKSDAVVNLAVDATINSDSYIKTLFAEALQDVLDKINKATAHNTVNTSDNNINIPKTTESDIVNNSDNVKNTDNIDTNTVETQADDKPKRGRPIKGKQLKEMMSTKSKRTRKTKEEKELERAEEFKQCQLMASEFVAMYYDNDPTIIAAFDRFLDVKFDGKYTSKQFRSQLNALHAANYCVPELMVLIDASAASDYRFIGYDSAKRAVENSKETARNNALNRVAKEYVARFDNDEKLQDILNRYTNEVILATSNLNAAQYTEFLKDLDNLSNDKKVSVLTNAYKHGWKTLVLSETNGLSSSDIATEVDIEEKEKLVDKFIYDNYLFLYVCVKDLLLKYIHQTANGKSMSAVDFDSKLQYFALMCVTEDEMKSSLKEAIGNNYPNLCREDFAQTSIAKKEFGTLEKRLSSFIRNRKADCKRVYKCNKDDPRLADVDKEYICPSEVKEVMTPEQLKKQQEMEMVIYGEIRTFA